MGRWTYRSCTLRCMTRVLTICAFHSTLGTTSATPLTAHDLHARKAQVIAGPNNTTTVIDPNTQAFIPQAPATDGGGVGFDVPAIIWLAFCVVIGTPLLLAGIRLGRFTTAAGCGLMGAAFAWTALANTINPIPGNLNGVSDLAFSLVVLGSFAFTFCLGAFNWARVGGIAMLALAGGASVGIRITVFRAGLLSATIGVDWGIVILSTVIGFAMLLKQRMGILVGAASAGSFLVILAVDLALNKQDGISRGIRMLLDRNAGHIADLITKPYAPTNTILIMDGISIALIPAFAYAQHRFFPQPFHEKHTERPGSLAILEADGPTDLEAGLKQDGIYNPEYYRRRGLPIPEGAGVQLNESRFASWRRSMGDRLQRIRA